MLFLNIVYFAVAAAVLTISAAFLVKSLSKISHILHLSEFTAAFVIMALATATPELFVGISSAMSGSPSLSLGNLIGSSILHLTLLTGIFVILGKGFIVKDIEVKKDMYYALASALLLIALFLIGGSLSRIDGAVLLVFFMFSYYNVLKRKRESKKRAWKHSGKKIPAVSAVSAFLISIIILLISARYLVKYSSVIAAEIGIPQIVIGLFLISFSTTLPEFVFGIEALKLRHKGMALGDLIGGVLINLGLIMGIVALIQPVQAEIAPFAISSIFLVVACIALAFFIKSRKKITVKESAVLIFLYIIFLIAEFFAKL